MKRHKKLKIVLISIEAVLGLLLGFIGGVLIFASVTTSQAKDEESMDNGGHLTTNLE